jgi:hypothetical protein
MARKPRRYPPSTRSHILAARYFDKETGDLVMLYQPVDPTVVVRIPAGELSDPECYLPKNRRRKVKR